SVHPTMGRGNRVAPTPTARPSIAGAQAWTAKPRVTPRGPRPIEFTCARIPAVRASQWGGTAMSRFRPMTMVLGAVALGWLVGLAACDENDSTGVGFAPQEELDATETFALRMVREGRQIFRHDTFGSESFWGGALRLHEAIAGQANGGVGAGLSPENALSLGLKVDAEALPAELLEQLRKGEVDLEDPASTLALLRSHAVVGVVGLFDDEDRLE